jgi:hypothetical protein
MDHVLQTELALRAEVGSFQGLDRMAFLPAQSHGETRGGVSRVGSVLARGLLSVARLAFLLPMLAWGSDSGNAGPRTAGESIRSRLSRLGGFYEEPFVLSLAPPPGVQVWFTTNGAVPSRTSGVSWTGALEVRETLTLRAAAFCAETRVGRIETLTYIFPAAVLRQTGAGFPVSWGSTNGRPVIADYAMDPEIVESPRYREELRVAWKSLPALSIVMEPKDLFDPQRGIYANPQESGVAWERPASLECLYPDGRAGVQINCGIRIQGGWNRRPEESPKHSFRLVFHRRYGQERLRFAPFAEAGPDEFDTLILRAGCNNTWLHWNGEERHRGEYLRDQWMRDTLAAMGHPSARGTFVHLYLNGLYWGLYNLTERPSAGFLAARSGGRPKEYDARNGGHILDGTDAGWKELMRTANAGIRTSAQYQGIKALLDMSQFIDYTIANLYGANADWDRASNWYAGRRRKPPGLFQFFVWDAERTLESVEANTIDADDDESPLRLFQKLRQCDEFRSGFAARARLLLEDKGPLGPSAAAERYRRLARQIDSAILMESARWGDYRRDVHPYKVGPYELYTRDEHWRPETDRLLGEYFPNRTGELLRQFHAAGLGP